MATTDDEVAAWLANQEFEHLKSYVARGRALVKVPTDELRARWVREIEACAQTHCTDHRSREDIQAEFRLRRESPPYDLAMDALVALEKRSHAETDAVRADPRKLAAKERELTARLERFKASAARATKN